MRTAYAAVGLLHHMMYQEVRQAFERIAELDPACGIAHWGVATALFQPLWPGRPDADLRERGWEAVQQAHYDQLLLVTGDAADRPGVREAREHRG